MDSMRAFWDRRALEDPFFFVDNRRRYRDPATERFWADGERDLDALLGALDVPIQPSDAVVELGCGVGRLTRVIAARAADVRAIDVSPRMVEVARRENPALANVRWLVGDGRSLADIAAATADACISHVVFQHIPDPAVTLTYVREIGRVLRPGGWAAFQVSNDARVHAPVSPLRRLGANLTVALRRGPHGQADPAWRGSAVAIADLESAAARGGMRIERIVGEGTQFCLVSTRRLAL